MAVKWLNWPWPFCFQCFFSQASVSFFHFGTVSHNKTRPGTHRFPVAFLWCLFPLRVHRCAVQPAECDLHCERDLRHPRVAFSQGDRRPRWCRLQHRVQEVPGWQARLFPLRRQRGLRPSTVGSDRNQGVHQQPIGSHSLQLWDTGCQRRQQQEPVSRSARLHRYHHQPGW